MLRSRPRTRVRPSARAKSYSTLEAAAIAAARRNDAMLLYVPDSAANVFSNADTGYLPASVSTSPSIGRWLDQQYGAATYGPELVTNGGFDSDISGWTQTLGSVSWQAGRLRASRGSAQGGRATYPLPPTVPGKTYRITCDRSIAGGVSSAGVVVAITAGSTVGALLSNYGGSSAWSQFSGVFVASQAQHWIALDTGTGSEGQYAEYDNISVREIVEAEGSRGPELFTNGNFASWVADDPVGWTKTFSEDASTYVTQVAGGARLVTTSGTFNEINQTVAVVGKSYELLVNVVAVSGTLVISNTSSSPLTITAPGIYRAEFTAVGTSVGFKRGIGGAACDATVEMISCKEVLGYHGRQPGATNKPSLTRVPRATSPEMVVNGGFDSATDWATVSTTISSGVLPLNTQFAYAQQDLVGLEVGASYVVSYDVISASGTAPIALSGTGFSGATQVLPNVVGCRNYFITTCTNAVAPLKVIAPNAGTAITIDNLSVKKVMEWSHAVQFDGTDDWLDIFFRDHFYSGSYTFIASWWGPVTGNSSFVVAQSSLVNTAPLVSPLFIPTSSINASIFERGDTSVVGLTGTTYATAALSSSSVVELTQVATPVGNFKGYLSGALDRNTNYSRVSESVTTNKLTVGAAQRTSVSGFAKGIFTLLCLAPSTMPDDDRRAIAQFAAFLNGALYA